MHQANPRPAVAASRIIQPAAIDANGVTQPQKFFRLTPRLARSKPPVMVCGSKSQISPTREWPSHCGRGTDQLLISFAIAFSNWRHKNNIPLKKIAADLGVSVSTVSSWELGERFPGGFNLSLLVEYTGLPPCKLFCVMAHKCIPAECLLAMKKTAPAPA